MDAINFDGLEVTLWRDGDLEIGPAGGESAWIAAPYVGEFAAWLTGTLAQRKEKTSDAE